MKRLKLLRLLRDVGNVPVEGLRQLVAATQDNALSIHEVFALAADAMAPVPPPPGPERAATRHEVDHIVNLAGWTGVRPDARDRENLAAVLELIGQSGTHQRDLMALIPTLNLVNELAKREVEGMDDTKDRVDILEEMVVGQVVYGEMFAILRRLAEEHYSFQRFGADRRV